MKLRNSKVIAAPHLRSNSPKNIRNNAHRDGEAAHHCEPVAPNDAASTTPSLESVVSDSTGTERLHPNHGRRKWTRDENIELMRCFYLAKQDSKGYQSRIKRLWDSRNPSKVSVSVNILYCHARNIQTANMLTSYELARLKEACGDDHDGDSTPFVPVDAIMPDPLEVQGCSDSAERSGDPVMLSSGLSVSEGVSLSEMCDNYLDELLSTLCSSPSFRGNTAVLEMLLRQFKELRQLSVASYPCLSRIFMSRKLNETIDEVNT